MGDERTLAYRSVEVASGARWWAWLLMWVVGVLYCVGGVAVVVVAIGSVIMDARRGFGPGPTDPELWAGGGVGAMIPMAIGITFVYGAGRVWQGSRGWARGGRMLALMNMALFLVEAGGMTYGMVTEPPARGDLLLVLGVEFFLIVAFVGMAWCLGRVMGEIDGKAG